MDAEKVNQLKVFIDQCKANPTILRDPSISFFRDYLERYSHRIKTKTPPLFLFLPSFPFSNSISLLSSASEPSSLPPLTNPEDRLDLAMQ